MSELTPSAREILAQARPGFGPSASARERMRAEVLRRAAAAGSTANEAPPSGVRLSLRAHGGKLLGASLVALVAATYGVSRTSTPEDATPAPADVVAAAPVETPAPGAEELASPHELPEAPIAVAPSTVPAEGSAATRPGNLPRLGAAATVAERPSASALPTGSLGEETRLLREAQAAFKSGELGRARSSVGEHARAFPHGVLREERLVLDVLLSCSEGRVEHARRTADELAASHPRSSHLDALRGSCAGRSVSPPPGSSD
ncbi:MAG: hypothetical protein KF850_15840 [Labilithrix sp.]|nr:hypothetical protein [Labilithrix sp.]